MTDPTTQPRTAALGKALGEAAKRGGYGSIHDFGLGFERGYIAGEAASPDSPRPEEPLEPPVWSHETAEKMWAGYRGKWVALHEDEIIASGDTATEAYEGAKAVGVEVPLLWRVPATDGPMFFGVRAIQASPDSARLLDLDAMRVAREWPTPNHMRRTADALDSLTPAKYGDILRWFADRCDEWVWHIGDAAAVERLAQARAALASEDGEPNG